MNLNITGVFPVKCTVHSCVGGQCGDGVCFGLCTAPPGALVKFTGSKSIAFVPFLDEYGNNVRTVELLEKCKHSNVEWESEGYGKCKSCDEPILRMVDHSLDGLKQTLNRLERG